jgi:hypothetical protein
MFRILNSIRYSHLVRVLALCVMLTCGAGAWATTYYWIGGNTGADWNSSANWNTAADGTGTSGIPGSSDTAAFKSSSGSAVTFSTVLSEDITIGTLLLDDTYTASADVALTISGSGSVTTGTFDFPDKGTYSTAIGSGVTLIITTTLYENMTAGGMTFSGSGTLYIPASGANVNWGASGITYSGITPLPYGDPSLYTIIATGMSGFPSSDITIKVETTSSEGAIDINFAYTVTITGSESYTLGGNSVSNGSTYDFTISGRTPLSKSYTLHCSSGSITAGNGITIVVKTPDGSMTLATIKYTQGAIAWTGSLSSEWTNVNNWTGLASGFNFANGLNSTDITIYSGVSNYPEIKTTTAVKSLTIDTNAHVTVGTGGILQTGSLSCSGNSYITSSTGTVEFNSDAAWSATYPSKSSFFNVTVDGGKTLTLSSDIYVSGNWTNLGTFSAASSTLYLTGNSSQSFAAGTGTYPAIVLVSGGKTGGAVTFTDSPVITALTNAGNSSVAVTFEAGCTVTDAVLFNTIGTVSFGNASSDTCTFTGGVTHTAGATETAGTIATTNNNVAFGALTLLTDTIFATGSGTISTAGAVTGGTNSLTVSTGAVTLGGNLTAKNLTLSSSSASLTANTNDVTLSGSLTSTGGTVTFSTGTISLAGDWADTGTFNCGSGTVIFTDNSVSSVISGTTTFNLFKCTTAGKTLQFTAGTTQTAENFTITGTAGSLIHLESTTSGSIWTITVPVAHASVTYAYVKDSTSTNASITTLNSSSGGNNINWNIAGQYTWTGIYSAVWAAGGNWVDENNVTTGYPGLSPNDTATVPDLTASSNYPVLSVTETIASLSVTGISYASVTFSGAVNLIVSSASSPLTNKGTIIYGSSGRIVNSSETALNDTAHSGTVKYTGSGQTLTDYGATDYANLIIDGSGTCTGNSIIVVSGTAEIDSAVDIGGDFSVGGKTTLGANVTTSGAQTYMGAVTLAAAPTLTAGNTAATGVVFSSTVDGASDLTFAGSTAASFEGAVGSTTAVNDVTTVGTTSFTSSFTQNTAKSFKVTAGTVTVGSSKFVCGTLNVTLGAVFGQTGVNANTAAGLQSVQAIVNEGSVIWDSSSAGGYLTVNGSISGTNAPEVVFNKKNVTVGVSLTLSGVFYDLTIPLGVTVTNGAGLCVCRNLTVNGSYADNSQLLTLGTIIVNSTTYASGAGGNISGTASSAVLGRTVIAQETTTKTFSLPVVFTTLDVNAGSGAVSFNAGMTAGTLNNTDGTFPLTVNGGSGSNQTTSVTNAVILKTSGAVTIGTDTGDTAQFSGGLSVPTAAATLCGTIKSTTAASGISFSRAVTLSGDAVITSASDGALIFSDTITGTAASLTLSGGTVDLNGAVTSTTGAITIDSAGTTTLSSAADITTTTGSVTFGGTLPGLLSTAADITTSGGAVTFTRGVTLAGSINVTTAGGAVKFSDVLDSDTTARVLTVNAGTGAVTFTGAVGGSKALASAAVSSCGTCTIDKTFKVTGNMSVTNSGLFRTAEDADITLSSGSFTQNGSGLNQLAGSITTFGTKSITFATDVYLYGSTGDMTLGGGGAVTLNNTSADLHVAAAGKTVNINSLLSAKNIALYAGTVVLGTGADITAAKDMILLGSGYAVNDTSAADGKSGVTGLFSYINSGRSTGGTKTAAPSLAAFPTTYPDGTDMPGSYTGTISGSGRILKADQNFYANGSTLNGFTLKLKGNDNAADAFAEAYNCTITGCTVTPISGTAYLAAAEGCTDGSGNDEYIAFSRPFIVVNNVSQARDLSGTANLSGTYTVYDDVIRVEFVDSLTGNSIKLENSNNEIMSAASHIQYYNGSALTSFTGAYIDADCTKSTDGKGDLAVFYLKAATAWKTDAVGVSAGGDESTTRAGTASSAVPYLNLPKALNSVYATLRDSHKNRIAHYYTAAPSTASANSTVGAAFTAVADRASPVLVAAYTGQELHTAYNSAGGATSQPYYDAHNFIELQYSEAVNIGDLTYNGGAVNQRAETSFSSAGVHGGALTDNTGGFTLAGLATFAAGSVVAGDRTTGSESSVVHSLYRTFSTTAGGTDTVQTHRVRIAVAGYVDGTITAAGSTYHNWTGYIDSAVTPSGAVASAANSFLTDTNGDPLDDYAASQSTVNHKLTAPETNSTESELYGSWDTSAPVFAPFRSSVSSASWADSASAASYEALGTSTTGRTTLDRIEFHLFDNTPSYSAADEYVWYTKRGWDVYDNPGTLYTSYSYAADLFGGSRPFDTVTARRTSGGIRYASVCSSASAFMYAVGTGKTPDTLFSTASVTGGAKSSLFITTTDTYHSTGSVDGLYFAVYLVNPSLSLNTTFTVLYNADSGFITDLAGNRLKSKTINTVDRTPPKFDLSVAPAGNNMIYIVFNKALNTGSIFYMNDSGSVSELPALEYIPKSLELVSKENGTTATGIAIDDTVPAQKIFENNDFTGLVFKLTKDSVLSDIKNVYVRVKAAGTATDPLNGISGSYVSYIQDVVGNYMPRFEAHAFSDFAVNVVQPQYAYDNRIQDGSSSSPGLYSDSSWAVHDWSASQQNYGTLITGSDIVIHARLYDGTEKGTDGLPAQACVYLDPLREVKSSALSQTYNEDTGFSWRVWLPDVTSAVFEALAPMNNSNNNTGFVSVDGITETDDTALIDFSIPSARSTAAGWKAGDQIPFLFSIMENNSPVTICHSPEYNTGTSVYSGTEYPLYALRLSKSVADVSDDGSGLLDAGTTLASCIDLWSFRLKSEVKQRGGVTILNNVINVKNNESTTVQVDMVSNGNLSVVVMTLDGNVITYLEHGTVSAGSHYYKWNGRNKNGRAVARGLYFVRVFGSSIDETRKVMVVKQP